MNDLITIPTVEQINLEHQLANSKANEAVQHATNCGLMLLQVKASKAHGEWLPWLKQQQESGLIGFSQPTASKYMKLAANYNRDFNLTAAPSIRAALELLSDKEPEEQQGTLIDVEAERQARRLAEQQVETERQARDVFERRAQESQDESNERRLKIRELSEQIDLLKAQPAPEPQVIEKIPDDYEVIKKQVSTVQAELTRVKQEQSKAIQEGIKTKLKSYQDEVDLLENKKRNLEKQAKDYQDYLSSLGSKTKQLEAQNRAIEKLRQALVDYASEIADFELTDNKETLLRWGHLLIMLQNAQAVTQVFVGEIDPLSLTTKP